MSMMQTPLPAQRGCAPYSDNMARQIARKLTGTQRAALQNLAIRDYWRCPQGWATRGRETIFDATMRALAALDLVRQEDASLPGAARARAALTENGRTVLDALNAELER